MCEALSKRALNLDLKVAPFRVRLYRVRGLGSAFLGLSVHHIVFDGWSLGLMLENVAQEYAAEQALAPIRPPAALAAPAAFHAFVEWEASQDLQPAKAYFRRLLRGAVAPEPFGTLIDSVGATTARSAPIGRCSEAARSRLDLDVSSLDLLASSLGCSLVSAMHAAWSIYYAARSGRRDVLYATTTSGRSAPIPHGERIVGVVLNTLPVRIRLDARQHEDDDENCFSGLIRRVPSCCSNSSSASE